MVEASTSKVGADRKDSTLRRSVLGCSVLTLLLLAAIAASWWVLRERARSVQLERAESEFSPVLEKMQAEANPKSTSVAASRPAPAISYDIDRTVQVIHQLDAALAGRKDAGSLRSYLDEIGQLDYRGVAPEVLKARSELLSVLQEIYTEQLKESEQEALWELSGEIILTALSTVEVGGDLEASGLGSSASFNIDRQRAGQALGELRARQQDQRERVARSAALDGRLIEVLLDYSEIYYRYLEEWDRLCVLRDRAYLAAAAGRWSEVKELSARAIELAPHETEAHILEVLARIELGEGQGEGPDVPRLLLQGFIQDHPEQSAPALLLLGLHKMRLGDRESARLDFQQSASYYPRQAERLGASTDAYRQRSYLRKTREGSRILSLYKSTVLGAGGFSPDLQLARLAFEEDDWEQGRRKVMDHFSRRRAQQRWDLILADLEFCRELLGENYRRIFPEEAWLDLEVKPTLIGSGLKLAVRNRSPHTLHNASLVLALQFTDMHPEDYETFPAAHTEPAVLAHKTTSFGDLDIALDLHGVAKGRDDIVQHRAVLITDEAVIWVDTDSFKIAEAEEFRARRFRQEAGSSSAPGLQLTSPHSSLVEKLLAGLRNNTALRLEKGVLRDALDVSLPRELAALRPIFRLHRDGSMLTPSENIIEGDRIKLSFPGPTKLPGTAGSDDQVEPELVLDIHTPYGGIELSYSPDQGGGYTLKEVER